MKIKMDSILNEINDGKNLDGNLSKYSGNLITNYYEYALVRLTMNYFTYYEVVKDKENPQVKIVKKLEKSIHTIMKNAYLSKFDGNIVEDSVKKLDQYRQEIIGKMQILTTYTDMLQVYEYVLNRLEYRFSKDIPSIDTETVIKEITSYIFESKDNVIINDKIKDIIGQLPIRMTKTKYFNLLSDSLAMYKGSDNSSMENYLYIMKTSAMLYKPVGIDEEYSNLISLTKELESTDYKNLNHKSYKSLVNKLQKGAEFIRDLVDIYVELEEIINNLYVLLLASPYVIHTDEKTEEVCIGILSKLNSNFLSNNFDEDLNELITMLEQIEGKQEDIGFNITKYESILYDIKERHTSFINSIMLEKIFHSLYTCQKLISSSLFIDINEIANNEVVDSDYITKVTEGLTLELKESFDKKSQLVNRAIMANTMNKMPVFFHNSGEVVEYIMNSLTGCNDEAEKFASINIIRQLME